MTDTAPDNSELIRVALDSRLLDVHVCLPGIVVSYDAATQTAEVQPAVKRPLETDDGSYVHETVAPIPNVPVAHAGGGTFSAHFDLAKGDTVLLMFSQWAFAQWRRSGKVSEAGDLRLHGPGYPVALPWWRPSGGPGEDSGNSMGAPAGLRLHFGAGAIGVGGQADFVAMAAKVNAALTALQGILSTLAGTLAGATVEAACATAGAALQTAMGSWPGASVASSNLKAD